MASFQIQGTRPATLSPSYYDDLKDVWDGEGLLDHIVAEPLFEPVRPDVGATIAYDGQATTHEEVAALVGRCLTENYNAEAETAVLDLFERTLARFTRSYKSRVRQAYVLQAAATLGLPAADDYVVYSAGEDVIPAARELLAQTAPPEKLLVSIAFAYEPSALGFWVRDRMAFESFKAFCQMEAVRLSMDLTGEAKQSLAQFAQMKLTDLATTLAIRAKADPSPQNEPGTFARFLVACAQAYANQNPDECGILPFDMAELMCPSAFVIVDVDAHAHASRSDVNAAWTDVDRALNQRPRVLSQNQIANLSAAQSALRNAQRQMEKADAAHNRDAEAQLRKELAHMRTKPPKAVDLVRALKAIMRRMGLVQRSENYAKTERKTYMRPNRRRPTDLTLPGRHESVAYYPSIHVYLDTSGSISEKHYASAVQATLRLAKQLNVDVKVNFFSHVMSSEITIHMRNRSVRQAYAEFRRAKKVTGGTDYVQIWDYIAQNPKRKRELSLIITDFEWQVPSRGHLHHPKHLYYYPVASENDWEWRRLVSAAKEFATDMVHLDRRIRKKLLF